MSSSIRDIFICLPGFDCLSRRHVPAVRVRGCFLALLAVAAITSTGCQVDVGGQTLPSAYYLQDDIQYFPAGPEFKLSKEAAALKAYEEELGESCETCDTCN